MAKAVRPDRGRVSVVVPVLDEELALPELLAGLTGAPGAEDRAEEVIVVDGGSRDRSAAIATLHGAVVLESARGRGRQLANGARAASGEILLFLHADMRLEPGALAALRLAFGDPRVVASGLRQRVDSSARFYRWIERAADLRVRLGRVYGDSALAVRRSAYEDVGGFRELPLFEDIDLCKRLRRRGRIALVDRHVTISARRWERDGKLARTLSNWMLSTAFALGVAPERLVRYYPAYSSRSDP